MTPSVNESEINEVIEFLRKKGQSAYANRIESLKEIERVGREQYSAGINTILEVEKALTQPVPRNLILGKIEYLIQEIKKVL